MNFYSRFEGVIVTVGMESVAEDLFGACNLSHLAAPLYCPALPALQLLSKDGMDFYRHCIWNDASQFRVLQGMHPTDPDAIQVHRIIPHPSEQLEDISETWNAGSAEWQDAVGHGPQMRTAAVRTVCALKADAAIRKGPTLIPP